MLCMAFLLAMTNVLGVCAEEPDVEDKPALSLSVEGIPAEPEVGQTFELTVKIKNDGAQEAVSYTHLDDVEMLEDLIVAAVNEAMDKVDEVSASAMSKFTGGMGGQMPGLF